MGVVIPLCICRKKKKWRRKKKERSGFPAQSIKLRRVRSMRGNRNIPEEESDSDKALKRAFENVVLGRKKKEHHPVCKRLWNVRRAAGGGR